MRNLVALRRAAWRLPPRAIEADIREEKALFCVNAGEQVVYLLDARSGRIDALAHDDAEAQPELLVELGAAILTADDTRWGWIEYVAELDAVVCGSTGGTLAVVDLQSREPEEIGALDGGLVGMAWSSNQETLALATGVGTLLIMNTQWEVLHETQLQAHLPSGLTLTPSGSVNMVWRDDAQYLVLNVSAEEGLKPVRKVFVFTQQLELHAAGRLEDGRAIPHLGDSLDWCPNHSLIASHETRKDQLFIVFFERNGLRHGEFALPLGYNASSTVVKQVQWNIQSDIVAIHVETAHAASRLLLWTRSNYHWYLKQEIAFDRAEDGARLEAFQWDDERATLLHLLVSSSTSRHPARRYEQLEFVWDMSSGQRRTNSGQLSVVTAVIDGHKLLLTPVDQALVPPPMALHSLSFDAPVNSVVFDAVDETLAVALSTGTVVVVTHFLAVGESAVNHVSRAVHSDTAINSLVFLRSDVASGRILFATKTGVEDALSIWAVDSAEGEDEVATLVIPSEEIAGVRRACEIVSVRANTDGVSNRFAVQVDSGRVFRVVIVDDEATLSPLDVDASLPVFSRVEVVEMGSDQFLAIGVSAAHSKLLVDGVQVAPAACSSFHFCSFSSVLLYTTLGSAAQLRLVPLAALAAHDFSANEESRVIERGARLVAVVGDRASVILQMPRGNLEGTSPRLLVLALVAKQIEALEYAKALEMSRRHRLDLNILVDFDAAQYCAHFANKLVDALLLSRPAAITSDRLCLFVTNLHVVDVWTTKYGLQLGPFLTSQPDTDASAVLAGEKKVNRVCQMMMRALETRMADHKDAVLLPFLTATVKQSPADFHAALSKVQELVANAASSQDASARAKRAMKHLIFLTQVDTLFDEALGMYDLTLVRFVAAYSQRDPKDYMPFLDACDALDDDVVRQFKIDVFLKRHSKALAHLSELLQRTDIGGELELQYEQQAAELITQGGLYDQALALFTRTHSNPTIQRLHRRVLHLKADFIASQGQHEEAGYLYLSIGEFTCAMQAFKSARVWRMALAAASRAKLEPLTELRSFAFELAQALTKNQKQVARDDVVAAARIYVEYCDDVDEAVGLLVAHKLWDESVRVALLRKRPDLVETDVETGVAVAYDAICDDIAQRQHEYITHWKRLSTIREQKRLFKLHGIDGSRWDGTGGDAGDAQSVVSGASLADSALSAASSLRSVGSHNSAVRDIGNFSTKSLAAATSSHFYATQAMGGAEAAAATAAAYKSKRYGGMPSRAERRRRIKEGSVEEEVHVAKQLRANAPSDALLRETRDVLRALVFFGHTAKAETLQRKLSAFEATVRDEFPMLEMPTAAAGSGEVETQAATHEAMPPSAVAWRFPAFAAME